MGVVAGWGETEIGYPSQTLQYAKVLILNMNQCIKQHGLTITSGMVVKYN